MVAWMEAGAVGRNALPFRTAASMARMMVLIEAMRAVWSVGRSSILGGTRPMWVVVRSSILGGT